MDYTITLHDRRLFALRTDLTSMLPTRATCCDHLYSGAVDSDRVCISPAVDMPLAVLRWSYVSMVSCRDIHCISLYRRYSPDVLIRPCLCTHTTRDDDEHLSDTYLSRTGQDVSCMRVCIYVLYDDVDRVHAIQHHHPRTFQVRVYGDHI
jgi:hypothetical protein